MSRLGRVTSDPSICHGKPIIRGLRHPVENLLELLASGMTIDEVVADHPELDREDLLAALEYAVLAVGRRRTVMWPGLRDGKFHVDAALPVRERKANERLRDALQRCAETWDDD